jgi:hypothetical protein
MLSRVKLLPVAIERRNAIVTSECPAELTKQPVIDKDQLQIGDICKK